MARRTPASNPKKQVKRKPAPVEVRRVWPSYLICAECHSWFYDVDGVDKILLWEEHYITRHTNNAGRKRVSPLPARTLRLIKSELPRSNSKRMATNTS